VAVPVPLSGVPVLLVAHRAVGRTQGCWSHGRLWAHRAVVLHYQLTITRLRHYCTTACVSWVRTDRARIAPAPRSTALACAVEVSCLLPGLLCPLAAALGSFALVHCPGQMAITRGCFLSVSPGPYAASALLGCRAAASDSWCHWPARAVAIPLGRARSGTSRPCAVSPHSGARQQAGWLQGQSWHFYMCHPAATAPARPAPDKREDPSRMNRHICPGLLLECTAGAPALRRSQLPGRAASALLRPQLLGARRQTIIDTETFLPPCLHQRGRKRSSEPKQ
jgi:hypothetical protein